MTPSNKFTVVFLRRAIAQYEDARDWYQGQSHLAIAGFINDIDDRVNTLREDPYRYRNTYKDFYEVSLKKYPYLLIYKVDKNNNMVFIASVHHHKQNPKRKYRR